MDTIPTIIRARGVVYLLDHDLEVEKAVDYLVRECAEHPKMKAAKDPRRLARNILSIGGVGAEKAMNYQAWKDALDLRQNNDHRQETAKLQKDLDLKDTRIRELEQELRSLNRDYRHLTLRALPEPPVVVTTESPEGNHGTFVQEAEPVAG